MRNSTKIFLVFRKKCNFFELLPPMWGQWTCARAISRYISIYRDISRWYRDISRYISIYRDISRYNSIYRIDFFLLLALVYLDISRYISIYRADIFQISHMHVHVTHSGVTDSQNQTGRFGIWFIHDNYKTDAFLKYHVFPLCGRYFILY